MENRETPSAFSASAPRRPIFNWPHIRDDADTFNKESSAVVRGYTRVPKHFVRCLNSRADGPQHLKLSFPPSRSRSNLIDQSARPLPSIQLTWANFSIPAGMCLACPARRVNPIVREQKTLLRSQDVSAPVKAVVPATVPFSLIGSVFSGMTACSQSLLIIVVI
jgi:hypothetical protein